MYTHSHELFSTAFVPQCDGGVCVVILYLNIYTSIKTNSIFHIHKKPTHNSFAMSVSSPTSSSSSVHPLVEIFPYYF